MKIIVYQTTRKEIEKQSIKIECFIRKVNGVTKSSIAMVIMPLKERDHMKLVRWNESKLSSRSFIFDETWFELCISRSRNF